MTKIRGTRDPDSIDGGDGDDLIHSYNGPDTVHGGAGMDVIDAGSGNDLLFGDDGDDRIQGESGQDTIWGGEGNDVINGSGGAADTPGNELHGEAGDDIISLVIGDTADGGAGFDKFGLNLDHWTLSPGGHDEGVIIDFRGLDAGGTATFLDTTLSGFETGLFTGTREADVVRAGVNAMTIDGNAGDDTIRVRGASTLFGGDGDDTLSVRGEGAVLSGGLGADVFAFRSVASLNGSIIDLEAGDVIDLHLIDADMTQDGDQAFTLVDAFTGHAGELIIEVVGDTTVIRIDRNGSGGADPSELSLAGDHADFEGFVL